MSKCRVVKVGMSKCRVAKGWCRSIIHIHIRIVSDTNLLSRVVHTAHTRQLQTNNAQYDSVT